MIELALVSFQVKDAADGEQTVEIVSERFGKSMINSCAQLSYEDAQSLLSDETTNERLEKVTSKLKHGDLQSLKRSLRHLNTVKLPENLPLLSFFMSLGFYDLIFLDNSRIAHEATTRRCVENRESQVAVSYG